MGQPLHLSHHLNVSGDVFITHLRFLLTTARNWNSMVRTDPCLRRSYEKQGKRKRHLKTRWLNCSRAAWDHFTLDLFLSLVLVQLPNPLGSAFGEGRRLLTSTQHWKQIHLSLSCHWYWRTFREGRSPGQVWSLSWPWVLIKEVQPQHWPWVAET